MSVSLSLQTAVRQCLIADFDVAALVAPNQIFDTRRPEVFPCIVMGEGQTVNEGLTLARQFVKVYLDLHVWTRGEAFAETKLIAGAAEAALDNNPRWTIDGGNVVDLRVTGSRFLRDPGHELQHAVITLEALVQRTPAIMVDFSNPKNSYLAGML